jgi:light-regulated signal transduction histidine kinase (bacteriophytochrome)
VHVHYAPDRDEQDRVRGCIVLTTDITEQKAREEALRASEERYCTIVQTAKEGIWLIDTKACTLYTNEHLAQMLGYMPQEMYGHSVLEFVFSRIQAGKLDLQVESVDLDAIVDETIENVQATTSTHQLLREGRADAQVMGDKDRLGQIVINLLTNAIKYSPYADRVLVRLSRDEQQAIVRVQDFGIGIDEAEQQKIFERFYQVSHPEGRTYPGLGIGLYLSHEIVERHHGRVWVESREGEGATFALALPLLQEEEPRSMLKPSEHCE